MTDVIAWLAYAFVRGLLAEMGQQAGQEAYQSLRRAVVGRYGQAVDASVVALEREPRSPQRREGLEQALRQTTAASDPGLAELIDRLLKTVDRVDPSSTVVAARKASMAAALHQIFENHMAMVLDLHARYPVDKSDLVSTRIASVSEIPANARAEVAQLHERIRRIVREVAHHIETEVYRDVAAELTAIPGYRDRQRGQALLEAHKKLRSSYGAMSLILEFAVEFNRRITASIEQSRHSGTREFDLVLGQSILVYEFLSFIVEYTNSFEPLGLSEIRNLHAEMTRRVAMVRQEQDEIDELANRLGTGSPNEESARDLVSADGRTYRTAIEMAMTEWDRYIAELTQYTERAELVRDRVPTLEILRRNAAQRIAVIDIILWVRMLGNHRQAMKMTMDTVLELRPAELTIGRIMRLLNIQPYEFEVSGRR